MGQSLRKSLQQVPYSGPTLSDPPSDLLSRDPTLSYPTPDCPPFFPDDHFLPPPGWLEPPDPSLQILASSGLPSLNLSQMCLHCIFLGIKASDQERTNRKS